MRVYAMSTDRPKRETMSLEEATVSNMWEIAAALAEMSTHTRMMHLSMLTVVLFSLNGCINIDTRLQPIDPAVQAVVTGEDCSYIILGLGAGTNTVEQAMANGLMRRDPERPECVEKRAVKRIRSITLGEGQILLFGSRCVTVTGEPQTREEAREEWRRLRRSRESH